VATTDWIGNSGDWSDPSHWSNGVPNDPSVTADLSGTTRYTVSIANENFTVGTLDISDAAATLAIAGTLTVDSSLNNAGTITVAANGAFGSSLNIEGDSVAGNSVEDNLGTVKLSGGGSLFFAYIQTINHGTIMLGSGASAFSSDISFDGTGSPETFTLGAGVTIQTTGGASAINAGNDVYTVLNDGKILARKANDRLAFNGNFINGGLIAIANNDHVSAEGPTFTNKGTITITSNGVFELSSSRGDTQVTYKTSDLGTIRVSNGGSLDIGAQAVLDNSNALFRVGDATSLHRVTLAGTIVGGTLVDTGNGFNFQGGILDHVKYRGDFDLNISFPPGEGVGIENGLTLTGANGTGPGTMEIGNGGVGFLGTQTFNNATITLGTDVGGGSLSASKVADATTQSTLTLGSGITLVTGAASDQIFGDGRIVNRGTIVAATSNGTLTIDSAVFTNDARFTVDQGEKVIVGSFVPTAIFNNNSAIEVTNGTLDIRGSAAGSGSYQIDGAGTLAFGKKTADSLSIQFYGTGGTLQIGTINSFGVGYVGGFAAGDTIDLKNFAYSSTIKFSFSDNKLTVSAGKRTATLNLAGSYNSASFVAASDGASGTVITYNSATPAAAVADSRINQFASAIAAHFGDAASLHADNRPYATRNLEGMHLLAGAHH